MTAKKTATKSTGAARKKSATTPAGALNNDLIAGPPKANPLGMSNPATRALATIGVSRVSQLAAHRESEIAELHGMGPSGIKALRAALAAMGKSFMPENSGTATTKKRS